MSLRIPISSALFALALAVPSCTGGQTGDEGALTDGTEFQGSQCNKAGFGLLVEGLSVAALSSEYEGLSCVSWQRDDDVLQLELTNVEGPCLVEVDWRHRVTQRDGVLTLIASGEPECRIAACGSCIYDFRFEVPLKDAAAALQVSFALEICEKLEPPSATVTLPLDTADEGVACQQLSAHTQSWLGRCGGPHQPCGDGETCFVGDASATECAAGLTCHDAGDDLGRLCLTPCESDADCPLPAVERCDDGVCQVPAAF
jgi:hypothetical protein